MAMDGIRPNHSGLLSQLSGPTTRPAADRPDGRTSAPPPPPPPPPTQEKPPVQPAQDALSARIQSFRATAEIPAIDREEELRRAVSEVTDMLKDADRVPFHFDRGAVAGLLSNPTGGPLRSMPSPPSPPARESAPAPEKPVEAAKPQASNQVLGVLNLFGRR